MCDAQEGTCVAHGGNPIGLSAASVPLTAWTMSLGYAGGPTLTLEAEGRVLLNGREITSDPEIAAHLAEMAGSRPLSGGAVALVKRIATSDEAPEALRREAQRLVCYSATALPGPGGSPMDRLIRAACEVVEFQIGGREVTHRDILRVLASPEVTEPIFDTLSGGRDHAGAP